MIATPTLPTVNPAPAMLANPLLPRAPDTATTGVPVGTITVIVCAYTERRWDDLIAVIDSLERQTLAPSEIILVIDHNPALLASAQTRFHNITIIENAEPHGLSGARNSGIAVAHGDIIAFIDEDAEASPDWLEKIAACYEDVHIMAAGGSISPRWMTKRPAWFPDEYKWVVGCTYHGMPTVKTQIRNLIGCNMSFRREVFADIGGFRRAMGRVGTSPVGCEETEMCIRARQLCPDKTILYDPAIRVINHRVPGTRATWKYFYSRCFAEGVSKALVAKFVGADDGLASERQHAAKVLPQGIARGLKDILRGDLSGGARSFAILSGLVAASLGLVYGTVRGVVNAR